MDTIKQGVAELIKYCVQSCFRHVCCVFHKNSNPSRSWCTFGSNGLYIK